jgi:hypothetical protein
MMEPETSSCELHPMTNLTSTTTCILFDNKWLCRHTRPYKFIYVQGSALTSNEFQELILSYGIVINPKTIQNNQAKSILESVHQVNDNMLRANKLKLIMQEKIIPASSITMMLEIYCLFNLISVTYLICLDQ